VTPVKIERKDFQLNWAISSLTDFGPKVEVDWDQNASATDQKASTTFVDICMGI
jgi:hypothetical protein